MYNTDHHQCILRAAVCYMQFIGPISPPDVLLSNISGGLGVVDGLNFIFQLCYSTW